MISEIIMWVSVVVSWIACLINFIAYKINVKSNKKVLKELDYILEQKKRSEKELKEIQAIKKGLLNYCSKCKSMLKLKK